MFFCFFFPYDSHIFVQACPCCFELIPTNYFLMMKCYHYMNEFFADFSLFAIRINGPHCWCNRGFMPTNIKMFHCVFSPSITFKLCIVTVVVILSLFPFDRRHYFRFSSTENLCAGPQQEWKSLNFQFVTSNEAINVEKNRK